MKILILAFLILGAAPLSAALKPWEENNIKIFEEVSKSVVFIDISAVQLDFFLGPQEVKSGLGSGFIWNSDGYIVTNYHVVKDANTIRVTFPSNKTLTAKFIGAEPERDIAVIKVNPKELNLEAIKIGNSDELKTGQDTIAIGNPYGLDHSMSRGIVSALGRSAPSLVNGVTIRDMIQTDAAINPGNSGGPLLNSSGELIGMNTQIYSQSGGSAGVGFAVPQKTISRIVPQLIQYGKVIRPSLGIMHNAQIQSYFNLNTEGVLIADVQKHGPAYKAGMKGIRRNKLGEIELGDIITQIGSQKIVNYDDLYNALDQLEIGQSVKITYIREGKKLSTQVTLSQLK